MRRRTLLLLIVPLVLLAADLSRPPASQWSTRLSLTAIDGYRQTLSPLLTRAGYACRFTPTCSRYAEAVLARDGLLEGSWKVAARLARCGPWTPAGTRDDP